MTGVACKPGCMGNQGKLTRAQRRATSYARQRQQHDAATARHASERQNTAESTPAADALAELVARWGGRSNALHRLRDVSSAVERLRREQDAALGERDELVLRLRDAGESWNSLVGLTGLSRQALSKRRPDDAGGR